MEGTEVPILIYIFFGIIILAIAFFIVRWVFAIDKRVRQNDTIINLLTALAEKQSATTTREKSATPAQIELQQKYDKEEISFEHYQKEWNKVMDK